MSFENLFRILPAEVVSKKTMGHLMTLLSIESCILDEPLRNWKARMMPLTIPNTLIRIREEMWINWNTQRSGLSVTKPFS